MIRSSPTNHNWAVCIQAFQGWKQLLVRVYNWTWIDALQVDLAFLSWGKATKRNFKLNLDRKKHNCVGELRTPQPGWASPTSCSSPTTWEWTIQQHLLLKGQLLRGMAFQATRRCHHSHVFWKAPAPAAPCGSAKFPGLQSLGSPRGEAIGATWASVGAADPHGSWCWRAPACTASGGFPAQRGPPSPKCRRGVNTAGHRRSPGPRGRRAPWHRHFWRCCEPRSRSTRSLSTRSGLPLLQWCPAPRASASPSPSRHRLGFRRIPTASESCTVRPRCTRGQRNSLPWPPERLFGEIVACCHLLAADPSRSLST